MRSATPFYQAKNSSLKQAGGTPHRNTSKEIPPKNPMNIRTTR